MQNYLQKVNLAGITKGSTINGPGVRTVIHFQGCDLGCAGCFNTHTWSSEKRTLVRVGNLVASTREVQGVTISGGEPFNQYGALIALLTGIRKADPDKSIIVFTGYSRDELIDMDRYYQLFGLVDVMVSGRYRKDLPDRNPNTLLSSTNQEYILLSGRHTKQELFSLKGNIEIIVSGDGSAKITGFPSVRTINNIRRELK